METPYVDLKPNEIDAFFSRVTVDQLCAAMPRYVSERYPDQPTEAVAALTAIADMARKALPVVKKNYKIVKAREFKELVGPLPPAVVEGLLYTNELILISGKPKAGKSFIIQQILHDISAGRPVFGSYEVSTAGPIIYLGLEDGPQRIKSRLDSRGVFDEDIPFYLSLGEEFSDISNEEGIKELESEIASAEIGAAPVCVCIDTARYALPIQDWNDAAEVTAKLKPLLAFARRTCLVMLIVHSRKSEGEGGDVISGSNALQSISDGYLILTGKKTLDNGNLEIKMQIETRSAPLRDVTLEMDTTTLHVRMLDAGELQARREAADADDSYRDCSLVAETIQNAPSARATVPDLVKRIAFALLESGRTMGEKKIRATLIKMEADGLVREVETVGGEEIKGKAAHRPAKHYGLTNEGFLEFIKRQNPTGF